MRTELEFSLRFIVDPNEPVHADEVEALSTIYTALRRMQARNLVGGEKLAALASTITAIKQPSCPIIKQTMSAQEKNALWRERKECAEAALARHHGDLFGAARDLNITTYKIQRWLAGPASSRLQS